MKKLSLLSLALAAACTSQTAGNQTGRLQADADAQHVGIYAYSVDGDVVTLFDRDGIEAGRVAVSSPSADRRVFNIELADGTVDDAEVYRPLADGSFSAPVTPETALTATMADPALAPTWAAHRVRFTVSLWPRFEGALAPNAVATTTSCGSPSSDTPLGCARPANTAVGCTNPSALPATITHDYPHTLGAFGYPGASSNCTTQAPIDCANAYGGTAAEWAPHVVCQGGYNITTGYCNEQDTGNQWIASCPRSTCGTAGQYDAVPRLRDCFDPGSCTKSQGTVGCTPYH